MSIPRAPTLHTQAYFAGAFGNADIHDVHDADTSHDERYAGNAGKQGGHQVGRGVEHGAKLLLCAYGEIVFVGFFEFMFTAQYGRYLFRRIVGHIF